MKQLVKVVLSLDDIVEMECELYDELVWFTSTKMKENKNLPTTKALCVYRLVDKQTGITVVADDEKDTLIKKYEGLKGQYEVFRKSKKYEELKERYKEKYGKIN